LTITANTISTPFSFSVPQGSWKVKTRGCLYGAASTSNIAVTAALGVSSGSVAPFILGWYGQSYNTANINMESEIPYKTPSATTLYLCAEESVTGLYFYLDGTKTLTMLRAQWANI
jgi:hypothetical protein